MKNIVLCFDRARDHPGPRDATNVESLLRLLDESDEQITWYHPGTRMPAADGSKSDLPLAPYTLQVRSNSAGRIDDPNHPQLDEPPFYLSDSPYYFDVDVHIP